MKRKYWLIKPVKPFVRNGELIAGGQHKADNIAKRQLVDEEGLCEVVKEITREEYEVE